MTATMLAIRLTAARPRGTIDLNLIAGGSAVASLQVLANDGTQERARAHGADFEQTHLFSGESHLRDGIVDHDAQLRMVVNLKRIGTHDGDFGE